MRNRSTNPNLVNRKLSIIVQLCYNLWLHYISLISLSTLSPCDILPRAWIPRKACERKGWVIKVPTYYIVEVKLYNQVKIICQVYPFVHTWLTKRNSDISPSVGKLSGLHWRWVRNSLYARPGTKGSDAQDLQFRSHRSGMSICYTCYGTQSMRGSVSSAAWTKNDMHESGMKIVVWDHAYNFAHNAKPLILFLSSFIELRMENYV